MAHHQPPSDWVAYVVVLLVTAATLYGKHLIAKGDEPINEAIKDDIKDIEDIASKVEKDIEEKIK